jgi:hypothetical protein
MKTIWVKIICWLFGHVARGPIILEPVIYRCERCKQTLQFNSKQGWVVWKNTGK